jgi:hypothetical protein
MGSGKGGEDGDSPNSDAVDEEEELASDDDGRGLAEDGPAADAKNRMAGWTGFGFLDEVTH